jgi:hypothetical protein
VTGVSAEFGRLEDRVGDAAGFFGVSHEG